jgi:hypothetical protein
VSPSKSKRPPTARPVNEPLEFERAGQRLKSQDSESRLRLQQLSERLHALGPRPLFHLLDEVERGAGPRASLEAYAALPVYLIRAHGGDRFGPRVYVLKKAPPND